MAKKRKGSIASYMLEQEYREIAGESKVVLKPRQKEFFEVIQDHVMSFGIGHFGTAKTFVSCYAAIENLRQPGNGIDKIIITKPIKESGEKLGFLKGELEDKYAPYAQSYWDTFEKIIGPKELTDLRSQKLIEFRPIAYMRGSTFDNSFIVVDEIQNLTEEQFITILTRFGQDSKMVLIGDHRQNDIPKKDSALMIFVDILDGIDQIGFFKFEKEDIVRNPLIIEIADRYDKYREEVKYKGKGLPI